MDSTPTRALRYLGGMGVDPHYGDGILTASVASRSIEFMCAGALLGAIGGIALGSMLRRRALLTKSRALTGAPR
jgi:hypothetical protein